MYKPWTRGVYLKYTLIGHGLYDNMEVYMTCHYHSNIVYILHYQVSLYNNYVMQLRTTYTAQNHCFFAVYTCSTNDITAEVVV